MDVSGAGVARSTQNVARPYDMDGTMRIYAGLFAAIGLLVTLADGAHAAKIGVAAAVKNQVEGVAGASPRQLSVGSDLFSNERIRTGEASTAQLLFLDKTVVNVGPKAELTLDRFVYNPERGTGQVVLDTVRGSFRFVTGSQNPTNYTIKTPVATLGIRGTIIDLLVLSTGGTVALLVDGSTSIRNNITGQVLNLTKPGTAFIINPNGSVTGPVPWDGTIVHAFGELSFPLYGWSFAADPKFNTVPFDTLGGIDNLNAIGAKSFTPGPAADGGGNQTGGGNDISLQNSLRAGPGR